MAARKTRRVRKKGARKKATRKKAPARKKSGRKKAARKKAGRKKATRKKAGRKKKAARKKAPRRKAGSDKWVSIYRRVLAKYKSDPAFRAAFRKDPHGHLARHGKVSKARLPAKVKAAVKKINWKHSGGALRGAKVTPEAW